MSDQTTTEPAPLEPAAPAEATPAEAPEPQQPETDRANPWENPEAARAEIERLRRENASSRVNAKQQAAEEARNELAQQIGKALGIVKDDAPPSVEDLTAQLTTQSSTAKAAQLELAIYKAASKAGADPVALTDSRSFMERATAADPGTLDALIGEHLTQNPRLKAAPAAPSVGGADFTSASSAGGRTFTRAQIADPAYFQANKTDILDAAAHGRITA